MSNKKPTHVDMVTHETLYEDDVVVLRDGTTAIVCQNSYFPDNILVRQTWHTGVSFKFIPRTTGETPNDITLN